MLVITLHPDDPVDIGDATIQLLETRDNQIRIGIDAPKSVEVVRHKARLKALKRRMNMV